jgi:hypothetical protein
MWFAAECLGYLDLPWPFASYSEDEQTAPSAQRPHAVPDAPVPSLRSLLTSVDASTARRFSGHMLDHIAYLNRPEAQRYPRLAHVVSRWRQAAQTAIIAALRSGGGATNAAPAASGPAVGGSAASSTYPNAAALESPDVGSAYQQAGDVGVTPGFASSRGGMASSVAGIGRTPSLVFDNLAIASPTSSVSRLRARDEG